MTDQMKIGRERYLLKLWNQAHNCEKKQKAMPEYEKSGQDNNHPAGESEILSILRICLKKNGPCIDGVPNDPEYP